jgi:hypothetical protein
MNITNGSAKSRDEDSDTKEKARKEKTMVKTVR